MNNIKGYSISKLEGSEGSKSEARQQTESIKISIAQQIINERVKESLKITIMIST